MIIASTPHTHLV